MFGLSCLRAGFICLGCTVTSTVVPYTDAPPAALGIITRNNISKPRIFSDGTIPYNSDRCGFLVTPSSYRVALADDKWCEAMASEFKAL
jgi:hypothetical protein